jgi:PAS domain S-box-containing protein
LTQRERVCRLKVVSGLRAIGGDVEGALERVSVPAYVIDKTGVIRWVNSAAIRVVGDVRGRQFRSVVAPEDRRLSRELFAQKVAGIVPVTDAEVVVVDPQGKRTTIEVSSVPLMRGDHVIGVFGQFVKEPVVPPPAHPALTPRQSEILRYLEHGHSTRQIAQELKLSPETVRNHVRGVLRALGARSRLEAVALARQEHLLAN